MWIHTLLSAIFPETHYERMVRNTSSLTPDIHTRYDENGFAILTCGSDSSPALHAAIRVVKKHDTHHVGEILGTLLADVLTEEIADDVLFNNADYTIVPMPLFATRQRARGFNHVAFICSHLPLELRALVDTSILKQIRKTKMQKTLSRALRLTNMRDAFAVAATLNLSGRHIILVDDVTTTGATLREAARALEGAGATVTAVALARA